MNKFIVMTLMVGFAMASAFAESPKGDNKGKNVSEAWKNLIRSTDVYLKPQTPQAGDVGKLPSASPAGGMNAVGGSRPSKGAYMKQAVSGAKDAPAAVAAPEAPAAGPSAFQPSTPLGPGKKFNKTQ